MTVQFRADRISYAINCLRIDHRLGRIRRTKRFVAALPLYCHRIADIAAGPVGVTRHVRPSLTPATMRQERRSVTFAPRRRCPRRVARAGVPACRGRRACAAARRSFNHRRGQAMRRAPRVGRRSHVAQRLAPASSAPAAAGRDGYVRLSLPQLARVSLAPICAAADDQILSELWDLGIGAARRLLRMDRRARGRADDARLVVVRRRRADLANRPGQPDIESDDYQRQRL